MKSWKNEHGKQKLKGVIIARPGFITYLLYAQAIVLNAICSWADLSAAMTLSMGRMPWV